MKRSLSFVAALALAGSSGALAQTAPPTEGEYMGQRTTITDRTDVEAGLPRRDTTVGGPMDAPPAGTVNDASPPQATAAGDLVAVIETRPELSTFAKLAEAAGLFTTFTGTGPLTILAPSNAAFAKLPPAQLAELSKPENAARLQQILLYHVIPAAAPTGALKGTRGELPTARAGDKVRIDGTDDALKVGAATVVQADLRASNGIVHVIDTVLAAPQG